MIFYKYIVLFPFTLLNPEIEVRTFNLRCLLWGNAQDWPCSSEHVFSDKCLSSCIKLILGIQKLSNVSSCAVVFIGSSLLCLLPNYSIYHWSWVIDTHCFQAHYLLQFCQLLKNIFCSFFGCAYYEGYYPYKTSYVFVCLLWDRVSCSPGWLSTWFVAKGYLEFLILLISPPKCWGCRGDGRGTPPHGATKCPLQFLLINVCLIPAPSLCCSICPWHLSHHPFPFFLFTLLASLDLKGRWY